MLGGHKPGEGMRQDTGPNPTMLFILFLSDYQSLSNGGDGWLRIMEFSPANNEITVTTYSPTGSTKTGTDGIHGTAIPPLLRSL